MQHTAKSKDGRHRPKVAYKKSGHSQAGLEDYVFGKVQPQALDFEAVVLGALMLDKDAMDIVVEVLKEGSFYKEAHQLIYRAILALYEKRHPIDLLTVTEKLKSSGDIDLVGGSYYLVELTGRVGSSASIEYHSRIIEQKAIGRNVIKLCSKGIKDAYEGGDVFSLVDDLTTNVMELADYGGQAQKMTDIASANLAQYEKWSKGNGAITGVPTGFPLLDKLTSGWQPSDLIILAARPGMGKTAMVLALAKAAAENGFPVALFSLEMAANQLVQRLDGIEAEVSIHKLKSGKFEEVDYNNLHRAVEHNSGLPIYIDDTPGINLMECRAKAKKLYKRKGIGLVIIDYLQLMSGDGNSFNREQEIAQISRGLKGLAKELGVPVIALSQLNRSVETRGGSKRPQLSDLRESGAVEQDSDIVSFIYRPEYYDILEDENGQSLKGLAEVIVAKHRNGPLDTVKLRYLNYCTKFKPLETDEELFDKPPPNLAPVSVAIERPKRNDDEDIPF